MTITPRIGASAIEFIRSKDGSEEKLVEHVSEELCEYLMNLGARKIHLTTGESPRAFHRQTTLTILRQEAEK